MSVKIVSVRTETLPALRFIGKRCLCEPGTGFIAKWTEWLQNGWFEQLEMLGPAHENGDAYLGAGPGDVYWIGMLFPAGLPVPCGFEYADTPSGRYAAFSLEGKKDGELLNEDGASLCFDEIRRHGWIPREGGWCYERYSRPGSVAQDRKEKILFECLMAIE